MCLRGKRRTGRRKEREGGVRKKKNLLCPLSTSCLNVTQCLGARQLFCAPKAETSMLRRRGQETKKSFLDKLIRERQALVMFPPVSDRLSLIYRGHGPLCVTSASISRKSGLGEGEEKCSFSFTDPWGIAPPSQKDSLWQTRRFSKHQVGPGTRVRTGFCS